MGRITLHWAGEANFKSGLPFFCKLHVWFCIAYVSLWSFLARIYHADAVNLVIWFRPNLVQIWNLVIWFCWNIRISLIPRQLWSITSGIEHTSNLVKTYGVCGWTLTTTTPISYFPFPPPPQLRLSLMDAYPSLQMQTTDRSGLKHSSFYGIEKGTKNYVWGPGREKFALTHYENSILKHWEG